MFILVLYNNVHVIQYNLQIGFMLKIYRRLNCINVICIDDYIFFFNLKITLYKLFFKYIIHDDIPLYTPVHVRIISFIKLHSFVISEHTRTYLALLRYHRQLVFNYSCIVIIVVIIQT